MKKIYSYDEILNHSIVNDCLNRFSPNSREKVAKVFYDVFNRHMASFNVKRFLSDFGLENLKKIEWNQEYKCLEVHFKNGDWWYYSLKGDWY